MAQSRRAVSAAPTILSWSLLALAIGCMAGGSASAAVLIGFAVGSGSVSWAECYVIGAYFLTGAAGGGFFWALSWLVRRQHEISLLQRRAIQLLEQAVARPVTAVPMATQTAGPARAADDDLLQQVAAELAEMNVNLLLSDPQRQAKRELRQQHKTTQLVGQIDSYIEQREFEPAGWALAQLLGEVPDYPHADQLRQRIEDARRKARTEDIRHATTRAKDFMASASFETARRVVTELAAKYPDSPEAKALVAGVERETAAYHTHQRLEMYNLIGKQSAARQWRSALATARKLMDAYPKSQEANLLRSQIQTIADNAHLEEVREMRDRIRDLINRNRFDEALSLAKELVERFPATAAADELRGQMDKLEERAKSERATVK